MSLDLEAALRALDLPQSLAPALATALQPDQSSSQQARRGPRKIPTRKYSPRRPRMNTSSETSCAAQVPVTTATQTVQAPPQAIVEPGQLPPLPPVPLPPIPLPPLSNPLPLVLAGDLKTALAYCGTMFDDCISGVAAPPFSNDPIQNKIANSVRTRLTKQFFLGLVSEQLLSQQIHQPSLEQLSSIAVHCLLTLGVSPR